MTKGRFALLLHNISTLSAMEYMYKPAYIFILLLQTLLLSVSSLQAKEMSSVDTKVLRTQQLFEELTLRAVDKGNLRNN